MIKMTPKRIKALRNNVNLSQRAFSETFSISVCTLRNWEQGARHPDKTASAFLLMIERDPHYVARVLGSNK